MRITRQGQAEMPEILRRISRLGLAAQHGFMHQPFLWAFLHLSEQRGEITRMQPIPGRER